VFVFYFNIFIYGGQGVAGARHHLQMSKPAPSGYER